MPHTAKETADEILRAAGAGAALAHIHARHPDGKPTQDVAVFSEIVDRVRSKSDIIIEISLGTHGFTAEEAMEPLVLRPDGATLPYEAYEKADENGVATIRAMAEHMLGLSVRPGIGILSPATHEGALALVREGRAGPRPCLAISLGSFSTMTEGAERLLSYTRDLSPDCHWWIMKGGSHQLALRALTISLGGHVRVGFEDMIHTYEGKLAASNAVFVDRMVLLAEATGRKIATPREARALLEMPMTASS
jgi:3-keto-5-aminohexanoate cleavage enzyme